jgi:general nucleoside transport system permease protein
VDERQEGATAHAAEEPALSTHAEVAPRALVDPVKVAGVGILLGACALWLVLPPVISRSIAVPLLVGACGVAAGAWAVREGARRAGWGAVASGLIGMIGGVFVTRASADHLSAVITWSTLFSLTLAFTTPLLFASLGGMFSERSGVVNIGLEGMMLMGAFFGAWGADKTNGWFGGLAIAVLAGALLALVHAYFSIHLRTDQIVSGTAINFLALGITGYVFNDIWGGSGAISGGGVPPLPGVPTVDLDFLGSIPPHMLGTFLKESFTDLSLLTVAAFALVPITYVFMFKTALGLRIRSCGEHPRAADTVGINVYAVRYASVVTSGALAACGGAFLSIGYVHSFSENMTAGRGFIALAALIFGNWRPFGVLGATLLFGFASALSPQLENVDAWANYGQLFSALPYLLTLIAVAGVIGRSTPPAAVGRPYRKQ